MGTTMKQYLSCNRRQAIAKQYLSGNRRHCPLSHGSGISMLSPVSYPMAVGTTSVHSTDQQSSSWSGIAVWQRYFFSFANRISVIKASSLREHRACIAWQHGKPIWQEGNISSLQIEQLSLKYQRQWQRHTYNTHCNDETHLHQQHDRIRTASTFA